MKQFGNALVKFLNYEDGPTPVEYALMLALVIVVCLAAVTTRGWNASDTLGYAPGIVTPTVP